MTLILSTVTPDYAVQTSDRLTSKSQNGEIRPHDIYANKTVIYRASDAIASISYSGLAYLKGIPTDSFLSDLLWGSKISAGPDGKGSPGMGFEIRPNAWTLNQAIAAMKRAVDSIPHWQIRQGGMYILLSGWRDALPKPRPFCLEISRTSSSTKASVTGTGRHWPYIGKKVCLGSVGASITRSQFDAMLAPYLPSGTLSAQNAEAAQIKVTRQIAAQCRTVGANLLSVIIANPQIAPVICRFLPATPHRARLLSPVREIDIEVGHGPWIIAPGFFQAPQLLVGNSVMNLGGVELHMIGAPPANGLLGLASSIARPAP